MAMGASLKEYARKRDFKRTAEPKGAVRRGELSRFVIQKHAASHLHYDFRLEMDGVLKSWAVPKGVPYAKGEKRLAMQVEDHPVDYIDFEGTIPKGQYGGGTVMVWDEGTYEITGKNELAKGKLHFQLHGKKLEGEWYLVQMHHGKEWLLIRGGEDMKPLSTRKDDTSASSGRSMAQIAKAGDKVWNSQAPPKKKARAPRAKSPPPEFIPPMKARLVAALPEGPGWAYEIKFDGWRAMAYKNGSRVDLLSRNNKDFTAKFPELANALGAIASRDCIIDGEIVALDSKGHPSFQLLQGFAMGEERPPIYFYAFDLLRLNGKDTTGLPLTQRKERLRALLDGAPDAIRYSASLPGAPKTLLAQTKKLGIEGLIAKRADSVYSPDSRNGDWAKFKFINEHEVVIGGYSEPGGSRNHFGALLVGYYEQGKLLFSAKVGTGFTESMLRGLYKTFQPLRQEECPFANLPEKRESRWGQAVTASEMRHCHWLKPVLVCQVKFHEWTRDGALRQPVFLGLREDKAAPEATREKPA